MCHSADEDDSDQRGQGLSCISERVLFSFQMLGKPRRIVNTFDAPKLCVARFWEGDIMSRRYVFAAWLFYFYFVLGPLGGSPGVVGRWSHRETDEVSRVKWHGFVSFFDMFADPWSTDRPA